MLRNILATSLFSLCAFSSLTAHAGIEEGDKTISIFGALQSDDYSDTLILQAAGGYFFTDTLEGQATILLIDNDSDGATASIYGFGANGNVYLPGTNPDLVPYVGAGMQLLLTDFAGTSDSEVALNAQAGIKQFLSESVTINYQGQFITSSDYDATIISVGFSIFLD